MNSEDVSELVLSRSNKQNAGTSTVDVEGTVEIHHPVLGASNGDGLLDLGPLSDKVSQHLRLNGRPASEFYGISDVLNCPLDDVAIGLFVEEDVPQRELGDHSDLVVLEVMAVLARHDQDGV